MMISTSPLVTLYSSALMYALHPCTFDSLSFPPPPRDLQPNTPVGQRPFADYFEGMYTCSILDRLDTIFDTIRKSRVHRFVVVDDANHLKGILTLSDILQYILLEGEAEET